MSALGSVVALLVSVGLLLMGNGLQTTLLPIRAAIENFSGVAIGIMGSAYFVGFVSGCVLGPRLVRRAGHIRAFAAFVALASAVAIIHPLWVDPVAWWALRAATGFCFAILYLVIESWLNERSTNETRGLVMSVYIMVNFAAIAVGQLLIVTYDPALFPLFSIASILVSVASVPITLSRAAAPAPIEVVRIRPVKLYRSSPVGVVGCFVVGLFNGAFWSLGPTAVTGSGFDANTAAVFMSAAVAGGALMQYPLGRVSDRIDRRLVLMGICLAAAVVSGVLFLGGFGLPLMVAGALFGAASLPGYAIAAAHAFDHAAPGEAVETSAGLLLANGAGSVVGPIGASLVMEGAGAFGLFAFTAAMQVMLAVFVAARMRVRAAPAQEEKTDFSLANAAAVMVAVEPEQQAPDTPPDFDVDEVLPPPFEPREHPSDEEGDATRPGA
ncbi:MFS transporter [Futiania mangrovi]|uniref:MFS transporter n=1 Tax=Futiania mangrovi TaxID=2959716 RepID=A0A9J6PAF2_9PROT|nr:MFS transporter [Futiania mangrovii]MCP1335385.1 MFS transporter [Futiania mangrovii]